MKKIKSVFTDKASIIIRKMLESPDKKWVIADFMDKEISAGWISEVLSAMEKEGYAERIYKGPSSYTTLRNIEKLKEDWIKWYKFGFNDIISLYSPDAKIENKIIKYFKDKSIPYALTLFSAARRIAPYVKDPSIHIYVKDPALLKNMLDFRQKLGLFELKGPGNVFIIYPYYKKSIYDFTQKIKGINIVSNIQLFLDLYSYSPRGIEQADYIKSHIK